MWHWGPSKVENLDIIDSYTGRSGIPIRMRWNVLERSEMTSVNSSEGPAGSRTRISSSQIPNIYVSNYSSCPCLSSITLSLSLLLAQRQRVACLCIACTCEPTRCSTVQNILGTVDSLILIQCVVSWGRHLTGLQNSLCSMILCDKKNKESCNRWYDLSLSETVCDHTKRQTKSTTNSKVLETTHLPCTSKTVRMCTWSQQNCTLETLFGIIKTFAQCSKSFICISFSVFVSRFLYDMVCFPAGRRRVHCGYKGMDTVRSNTQVALRQLNTFI